MVWRYADYHGMTVADVMRGVIDDARKKITAGEITAAEICRKGENFRSSNRNGAPETVIPDFSLQAGETPDFIRGSVEIARPRLTVSREMWQRKIDLMDREINYQLGKLQKNAYICG